MTANLFEMAAKQLAKENKPVILSAVITKAVAIRKWLDKHEKTAEHIAAGGEFYRYGKRIVTA